MLYKYNYINLILSFFVSFISNEVLSQHVTLSDSIIVRNSSDKGLVFDYEVKKGNTIYSISRVFNADLIDIYAFNEGINSKPLSIGDRIIIPFDTELLNNKRVIGKKHFVFYKVGKKENLFRIAKMYFGVDVESVIKLNNLPNSTIQPNQLLKIGYVVFSNQNTEANVEMKETEDISDKTEPKEKLIVKDSVVENRFEKERMEFEKVIEEKSSVECVDSVFEVDKPEISVEDSGSAFWNKESRTSGVFVLHNNAGMNTLMEIYNPMVNRKIFAKVIGRIPPNEYQDNIKIILSPMAARSLGALNRRFFVEIKYIKK